jgi:RNA recognition motif-containing protein
MDRKCVVSKEGLQNTRVLQRNLVYVVGIPCEFARPELLMSSRLFGKHGEIVKVVVSKRREEEKRSVTRHSHEGSAMFSAYVTYRHEEDALSAIKEMDGVRLGERILRCTFGTTKYCSFFLRGVPCVNEECLYLHREGSPEESFSREDMALLKSNMGCIIERRGKRGEEERSEYSDLDSLFIYRPQRDFRQRHSEKFHFNPFAIRSKPGTGSRE